MFDADRPILNSAQDRLGRTTFAKSLARSLLDHQSPDSLVLGLYGTWGSGKTSLINLMIEELQFASSNMFDDERPIILNFSPWSYSGQNQLIYSFFRRLSSELRQSPFLENAGKIIYLLELYISFFTHQPIPRSLRPKRSLFTRLFKPNKVKDDIWGWESGRDLTQVKKQLNEILRHQKHKIIIVIDNIARLSDAEIEQIFQIVKSIGDFNQTMYVLAMDKAYVTQALDKLHDRHGEEYLDKLVQLPFYVPAITDQDLENILVDRLQNIIRIVPEDSWNKDYWADVYYSTLRYLFKNVRDITHYINTLGFGYIHFREVVNPVDFFALTAIEVFAPKIYNGIRDNKDLFTDLMDDVYRLTPEKIAEDKLRCDEIISREKKISSTLLVHLLMQIFPRLRYLYETAIPFYHSEAIARKNKRACSPDLFEVYFRLSLPMGTILESEFAAILALAHDEEGFALALLRLNQDERILKFLNILDGLGIQQIPVEETSHVLDALVDSADMFPEGRNTPVSFATPMRIHRIIHQLLRRFESSDKRFELFRKAIKKATHSIYIIVHELTVQMETHAEQEDTSLPVIYRDFTFEQLDQLQKLAVVKIIYWADIGRLIEHPKIIPILYAWKAWGNVEDCRRYLAKVTQEDRGLIAFLTAALKQPIDDALIKNQKNMHWQEALANIENFIDPHALEPHAKELFEDEYFEKLREREQLALLIFLDLIKAKTNKIIPRTDGKTGTSLR